MIGGRNAIRGREALKLNKLAVRSDRQRSFSREWKRGKSGRGILFATISMKCMSRRGNCEIRVGCHARAPADLSIPPREGRMAI